VVAVGADDVTAAAAAVLDVLEPLTGRDWSVRAGDLEWSCAATASHIAHDLTKYAAMVAGRVDGSYLRFRVVVSPDEPPAEILRIVGATAQLLVAAVATAPDDARAWHHGAADRSGFAAMGIGELLVHTFDVTAGLGVAWRPPARLAELVLARLLPDVSGDDPALDLLWATGRLDRGGSPPARDWVWRAAVSGS
jgi:uncharacterized protein (TIGR03083 family)